MQERKDFANVLRSKKQRKGLLQFTLPDLLLQKIREMTQPELFDFFNLNRILNKPTGHFFNTIKSEGEEKEKFEKEAKGQEAIVMKVFESGEKLTALAVTRKTGINQDSCKRSISVLKKAGKLVKLKEMTMEQYGKKNHYYQKI